MTCNHVSYGFIGNALVIKIDQGLEKLELRVGKDLQYVRINGTLVGFLVGGLIYAVTRGVFGAG